MDKDIVFFVGRSNHSLGERIVQLCEFDLSQVEYTIFADGEYKPKLGTNVRGRTVYIIQPTNATIKAAADNLYELLLLVDAAKRASAEKIIAVIPYFGNARQERKDEPRTPITAKLSARLLEVVGINKVITMDLHADAIQGFFEIPVDNIYASYLFVPVIKKIMTPNTIFASADAGGMRRATAYAKHFETDVVACYKTRKKPNEVSEVMVIGDPSNKDVIIIEDIIDTAGTICKASDALKTKGANSVKIFSSHGLFSRDAYKNIENSSIEKCYVTDSLQNGNEYLQQNPSFKKLDIIPSAELFAKAIRRNIKGSSIKELFLF